jgi:hypothetical protein
MEIERTTTRYRQAWSDGITASQMLDSRDYQTVLRILKHNCNRAKQNGDRANEEITSTILKFKSGAFVEELFKARGLIQALHRTSLCAR